VLALAFVVVPGTPVVVGMLIVLCVEDVPSDEVVLEPGLEDELEPWLEVELPVVVGGV
jgi:hypothetical protein